jgi:hypothetical protein
MRRGSRGRRLLLLIVYTVASLIVLIGVTVAIFKLRSSNETLDTRLTISGDVLTAGTLLLAMVAGFVALQAFAVTTGLPKLQIQVWFDSSDKNRPIFQASKLSNGWLQTIAPTSQTQARIRIRNHSNYPARDLAITIQLNGMALKSESFRDTDAWWSVDSTDNKGIREVQWDGRSDYLVHGNSVRRIPDLDLGVILRTAEAKNCFFHVRVLSSPGYERTVKVPVVFATEEGSALSGFDPATSAQVSEWL